MENTKLGPPHHFPDFKVSHVGLFVFDIDLMVKFFTELLGLHITDQSIVRGNSRVVFLSRDPEEHHQLVLVEGRTAATGEKLLNQISLRVASIDALRDALEKLRRDQRVTAIDPCNHGNAFSVYFQDPEGNRFELLTDSPFYVKQAVIDGLDLSQSNDELVANTKARHEAHPTFKSAEKWRAEFAEKLAVKGDR